MEGLIEGYRDIFTFEIGDEEKHKITFIHDRVGGEGPIVLCDGRERYSHTPIFGFAGKRLCSFMIGETEKHLVEVDIIRPFFFSIFRKWRYRVYVDEHLLMEY